MQPVTGFQVCSVHSILLSLIAILPHDFSDKSRAWPIYSLHFTTPDGSCWGDVLAVSVDTCKKLTDASKKLTDAMQVVADTNEKLKGVFTVDWNQSVNRNLPTLGLLLTLCLQ